MRSTTHRLRGFPGAPSGPSPATSPAGPARAVAEAGVRGRRARRGDDGPVPALRDRGRFALRRLRPDWRGRRRRSCCGRQAASSPRRG